MPIILKCNKKIYTSQSYFVLLLVAELTLVELVLEAEVEVVGEIQSLEETLM